MIQHCHELVDKCYDSTDKHDSYGDHKYLRQ
jgi:hypothetical protein